MRGSQDKVLDLRAVFGLEATITTPSAQTDGAYVEMDVTLQPGGDTAIHYHPDQEETYEILSGTLEVFGDDGWRAVPAGKSLTVPQGAVHGFRNTTETPVRFLNVHRPALAFQEHLETLHDLIRAGKITGLRNLRSLIYMSVASIEQEPSITVKPPHWLIRGLASIGRRLGYTLD